MPQRSYHILFVPDPTRGVQPTRAQGDLAFLKTSIHSHEYELIKHLTNSVHLVSHLQDTRCTVQIQEWVCLYSSIMNTVFIYANVAQGHA